jgi:G3E family GTPase
LLLTGYLGAGKTTLLNHLLGLPEVAARHPALLINEFGSLGVDAQRVPPGRHRVFEINQGSLFCICTKTSFLEALRAVARQGTAGVLLVEATGVSETRDIEGFLEEPALGAAFTVQANLCVVDALHFTKVVAFLRAVASQVQAADGLVLNKTDLVAPAETARLQRLLAELNGRAPQRLVDHGRVPYDFIAGLAHRRAAEARLAAPPPAVCSLSFQHEGAANREDFAAAVGQLGERLLRLKGHVRFADGLRFVEVAGGRYEETAPLPGAQGTAFTAIAWKVPRDTVAAAFGAAFGAPALAAGRG